MGKRSDFKRRPQDAYDTPPEAVVPLLGHMPRWLRFWEPCAGCGMLAQAIQDQHDCSCIFASDISPRLNDVSEWDAMHKDISDLPYDIDYIITNPPWTRKILHPMIEHFSDMRPTWLLFDADWIHTKQSAPYLWRLQKIVSVGRVSWMQNGTSGKDNCAWYLFDKNNTDQTRFFGPVVGAGE